MAVDFNKFNNMINKEEINKQINAAPDYEDVPAGVYNCVIMNMEVKETKAGDKLMFTVQLKITDTVDAPKKQNGRYIFFNRVICGNKTTEKWNDGRAIKGVITWVSKLLEDDSSIEFIDYDQFAKEITEIFEDVQDNIEIEVKYAPDAFNPVEINDVFDL